MDGLEPQGVFVASAAINMKQQHVHLLLSFFVLGDVPGFNTHARFALSFRAGPSVEPVSINPLFEVGLLGQGFRNPGSGIAVEPAGPSFPDQR